MALTARFGIPVLGDLYQLRRIFIPQFTSKWELILPRVKETISRGNFKLSTISESADINNLIINPVEVTLPTGEHSVEEVYFAGNSFKFPSQRKTSGDLVIKVAKSIFDTDIRYFNAWMLEVMDEFGYVSVPITYKKTIVLRMLTGLNTTSMQFRFSGCFIKSIEFDPVSYEKDDIMYFTATFSVDDASIIPHHITPSDITSVSFI